MSLRTGCKVTMLVVGLCLATPVSAQQANADRSRLGGAPLVEEVEPERLPDPARGETLFRACLKCHAVNPGEVKIGPSLAGVFGRRPGSEPAFGYSQDMIDFGGSGAVWDEDTLDRFLVRPRAMIAGTKMVFEGFRKPYDRDDLIAFLAKVRG